ARSTLFLYTTLFRSGGAEQLRGRDGGGKPRLLDPHLPVHDGRSARTGGNFAGGGRGSDHEHHAGGRHGAYPRDRPAEVAGSQAADRKSTRLNSSHVK